MTTYTRRRLAQRIEEAFLDQQAMEVYCDPDRISFPRGHYRTDVRSDTYRWTAFCTLHGLNTGPSVDSYDTAGISARFGITLDKLPVGRGWEATAKDGAQP